MQQCAAPGADAAMPSMRLIILSTVQGTKTGSAALNRVVSHTAYTTKPASCAKGAGCSRPDCNSVSAKSMLANQIPVDLRHSMKPGISMERRKPLLSQNYPAGHAILQVISTAAVIAAHSPKSEATDGVSRSFNVLQLSRKACFSPLGSMPPASSRHYKVVHNIHPDHISKLACTDTGVPSHKKACVMYAYN